MTNPSGDKTRQLLHRAHVLAHRICLTQAQDERGRDRRRLDIGHYFDPLAATCLGDLIYHTMTGRRL